MADIDVERKGPSIWPWIIGLIILALLIWLLVEWLGDDDDLVVDEPVAGVVEPAPVAPMPEAPVAGALPAPVQQYVSTCTMDQQGSMALDHAYTSNCTQMLVDALDAVVRRPELADVDVQAQLEQARQNARRLAESPEASTQHANMARDAFTSIATVVDGVQNARYPTLDPQAGQLQQAAQSVQGNVELLNQRDAVHSFFRQAGDVLRTMATTAPAAVR